MRWLDGQGRDRLDEAQRLLRAEPPLPHRCRRCRADPEVALALAVEPLAQPDRCVLHPPILGEAPRELLRRLLWLELESSASSSGKRWRAFSSSSAAIRTELAAGVEIELVALRESLDERDDDPGHVDLRGLDRVLEQQREKEIERALERIEVQLEIADGSGHVETLAARSDAALRHGHRRPAWRRGLLRRPRRFCESQNQTSPATQTIPETHVFTRRPRMWFAGSTLTSSIQKRPKE